MSFSGKVLSTFRSLLYIGNDVTCPVCNCTFRRFMPGGNDRRPDARCPRCDALERHRLFWLFLKERTKIFKCPCSLLHFAPELSFKSALKGMPHLDYTTADLNSPLAEVHTDITSLLFPDSRFDCILCLHVLEHINDDRKALAEMYRVLKPGGTALIMTPVDGGIEKTIEAEAGATPEERKKLFGAEDHVRSYGKDFTERLRSAGFTVDAIDFYGELDTTVRQKYGLLPEELIYRCTRPA